MMEHPSDEPTFCLHLKRAPHGQKSSARPMLGEKNKMILVMLFAPGDDALKKKEIEAKRKGMQAHRYAVRCTLPECHRG